MVSPSSYNLSLHLLCESPLELLLHPTPTTSRKCVWLLLKTSHCCCCYCCCCCHCCCHCCYSYLTTSQMSLRKLGKASKATSILSLSETPFAADSLYLGFCFPPEENIAGTRRRSKKRSSPEVSVTTTTSSHHQKWWLKVMYEKNGMKMTNRR